ncbi:MAG: HEPN domain-containing protein [Planctomycetota bacterium]|jgi:HEPN domain-containing protein
MPERVDDWIAKADGDFDIAQRESRRRGKRNFDAICFHAHECVEKLMKAVLVKHGVAPEYTHNLVYLDACVKKVVESWKSDVDELSWLTRAGVAFRYPGEWATDDHTQKAMVICTRLRGALLKLIDEGNV